MSPQEVVKDRSFIQDQLEQTTKDLFNARSVREIQFLQQKLVYLKTRMKEAKKAEKTLSAKKKVRTTKKTTKKKTKK